MSGKKTKITILALLICCIALAAGGSLARPSTGKTTHNVISSSGVTVELHEKAETENGLVDFAGPVDVMPGLTVSKIVTVENTGGAEAWVRILAELIMQPAEGVDVNELDSGMIVPDFNMEAWVFHDGYFYYLEPLKPGDSTEPLFTEVYFLPEMDNSFQNSTLIIEVSAQAVQTANNGESVDQAIGWPEEPAV